MLKAISITRKEINSHLKSLYWRTAYCMQKLYANIKTNKITN